MVIQSFSPLWSSEPTAMVEQVVGCIYYKTKKEFNWKNILLKNEGYK
jgi:hypothetical protein